jgi:hypothetical protein
MLGLFLALQILATSSSLHCWLHPDSASPDHQCVVRIVANGDLDHSPASASAPVPQDISGIVVLLDSFVLVTVDYRLLPGRAPPQFFS